MERPTVQHPSEMTPTALLCTREGLGLSMTDLGAVLGLDAGDAAGSAELWGSRRSRAPLDPKTVRRWEQGTWPISEASAAAFAALIAYTDEAVRAIVEAWQPGEPIVTYVDDESFHAAEPWAWRSLPASWHRAVVRRVKEQTGATIV